MTVLRSIWKTTKFDAAVATWVNASQGKSYNGLDMRIIRLGNASNNTNGRVITVFGVKSYNEEVARLIQSGKLTAAAAGLFIVGGDIHWLVKTFDQDEVKAKLGGGITLRFILKENRSRVKEFIISRSATMAGGEKALFHFVQKHSTDPFVEA